MLSRERRVLVAALAAATQILVPIASAETVEPCLAISRQQIEAGSRLNYDRVEDINRNSRFDAETAFRCVSSVQLDTQAATQMIKVFKDHYSFHSTLAYLKDPPASYQAPAVDILGRVDQIAQRLKSNEYKNQYELDLDFLSIAVDVHDLHFTYSLGVLGVYQWALNESIVSVSLDGKELPQVYAYSDIRRQVNNASPIVELNGDSVFTYLRNYLAKTASYVMEPHAEWNGLMENSAYQFGQTGRNIRASNIYSRFQSTPVYNGPSLKGRFANVSSFEWAYHGYSTENLTAQAYTSPGNILNKRVLNPKLQNKGNGISRRSFSNLEPDRSVALQARASPSPSTKVPFSNYPSDPTIRQANFSVGGFVSGYLLKDSSVGVLSLPSYDSNRFARPPTFHNAVADFIKAAKDAGMKKIVIDLSGNTGGTVFLAPDVFKQFFPTLEPKLVFRSRATPQINTLGSIATAIIKDGGKTSSQKLFGDTKSLLATNGQLNANFSVKPDGGVWNSWQEYYGPVEAHGDNFTQPASYDYSNSEISNRDLNFDLSGYGNSQISYAQPWAAEDIILLHDGTCASTCALFSYLMRVHAGVKSIAVGGIPQNGPMQGVAGTRGGNVRRWDFYSKVKSLILEIKKEAGNNFNAYLQQVSLSESDLANLPQLYTDVPWLVREDYNSINSLDQLHVFNKEGTENVPLHFMYQASNCRIFYTPEMVLDVTKLWQAAARFAGGDESACVPASVNGPGSDFNDTMIESPGFTYNDAWDNANSTKVPKLNTGSTGNGGGDSDSAASVYQPSLVVLAGTMFALLLWA